MISQDIEKKQEMAYHSYYNKKNCVTRYALRDMRL